MLGKHRVPAVIITITITTITIIQYTLQYTPVTALVNDNIFNSQ